MSNRQARREQMRSARPGGVQRPTSRPTRPPLPGAPRKKGRPDWLTGPYTIGVAALVVVLGGILVFLAVTSDSRNAGVEELERALADLPVELANGNKLGRDDAPLKITMFEDFQCPHCLSYSARQEPFIIENFVKEGKVQLIFQHLPILGIESTAAAKAAVCAADQNKFWQYHNGLFRIQAEAGGMTGGARHNNGLFSDSALRRLAQDVGMDVNAYEACLNDPATIETISEHNRQATSLGLRSTPSFLFNGVSIGAGALADTASWERVINEYLAQQEAGATATPGANGTPAATPAASPTATATP